MKKADKLFIANSEEIGNTYSDIITNTKFSEKVAINFDQVVSIAQIIKVKNLLQLDYVNLDKTKADIKTTQQEIDKYYKILSTSNSCNSDCKYYYESTEDSRLCTKSCEYTKSDLELIMVLNTGMTSQEIKKLYNQLLDKMENLIESRNNIQEAIDLFNVYLELPIIKDTYELLDVCADVTAMKSYNFAIKLVNDWMCVGVIYSKTGEIFLRHVDFISEFDTYDEEKSIHNLVIAFINTVS